MFVVGSINYGGVPDFRVRDSRISAWQKQTGTPFDPFESMAVLQHRRLHCPKCGTRVYVRECSLPSPYLLYHSRYLHQRLYPCRSYR